MDDIKIDCLFKFELYLDREMMAIKALKGSAEYEAMYSLCVECFKIGLKAGKMPVNKPINLGKIK